MSLLEPSFQLTQDSSPLGDTTVIEVYGRPEEEKGIALYREIESLAAMRKRLDEDKLVTDEDVEPQQVDVRFEIKNDRIGGYEFILEELLEEDSAQFEQYRGTTYTAIIYDECGREYDIRKWDDLEVPAEINRIWGELRRATFQNTI